MMALTYTCYSSHGKVQFDESGKRIASTLDKDFGPLPHILDIEGMRAANGGAEVPAELDILMAAYWRADGVYVPVVWNFEAEEVSDGDL